MNLESSAGAQSRDLGPGAGTSPNGAATAAAASTPQAANAESTGPPAAAQPAAELSEALVREELKNVIDPEIGLDVINLGLIYEVQIQERDVHVLMTLTSPGCPVAGMFMNNVKTAVEAIPGVAQCTVDLTFSPPWDPRVMASDEAKLMMGFYY